LTAAAAAVAAVVAGWPSSPADRRLDQEDEE